MAPPRRALADREPVTNEPAVYVLHDNPEWIPAFARAFEAEGVELREWPLGTGSVDLDAEPPRGIFWSRLSASSHTRGAEGAKDAARATLAWLEGWNRRVVGGSRVAALEVSKVAQHAALRRAGFDVPRTIAVFGIAELEKRARELPVPFITKHNQGGKGLGVRRFDRHEDFDAYVAGSDFEPAVDGITLLQEYFFSAEPFITRAEFVGAASPTPSVSTRRRAASSSAPQKRAPCPAKRCPSHCSASGRRSAPSIRSSHATSSSSPRTGSRSPASSSPRPSTGARSRTT